MIAGLEHEHLGREVGVDVVLMNAVTLRPVSCSTLAIASSRIASWNSRR